MGGPIQKNYLNILGGTSKKKPCILNLKSTQNKVLEGLYFLWQAVQKYHFVKSRDNPHKNFQVECATFFLHFHNQRTFRDASLWYQRDLKPLFQKIKPNILIAVQPSPWSLRNFKAHELVYKYLNVYLINPPKPWVPCSIQAQKHKICQNVLEHLFKSYPKLCRDKLNSIGLRCGDDTLVGLDLLGSHGLLVHVVLLHAGSPPGEEGLDGELKWGTDEKSEVKCGGEAGGKSPEPPFSVSSCLRWTPDWAPSRSCRRSGRRWRTEWRRTWTQSSPTT